MCGCSQKVGSVKYSGIRQENINEPENKPVSEVVSYSTRARYAGIFIPNNNTNGNEENKNNENIINEVPEVSSEPVEVNESEVINVEELPQG